MSHVSFPRFAPPSASTIGRGPLGDDQLRRLAPSAFAAHKHESRSERYTYIPTSAVIDGLRANGFEPTFAKQGRSRIPGKADFTKHLIRFRRAGQAPALRGVGDTYPEVVLINSHDGTSAYQIMAGLFRWLCPRISAHYADECWPTPRWGATCVPGFGPGHAVSICVSSSSS